MNQQRMYLSDFVSRVERRRRQNRLNQRAARQRKAHRHQQQAIESESIPTYDNCASNYRTLSLAISDSSRALLSNLRYSANLDQARTLSPVLADPLMRSIWTTAVNNLWPSLEYNDLKDSGAGELTRAFFLRSLADPLLFSAQTCTNSVAIAMVTQNSRRSALHNIALAHESRAVELLREEFSAGMPSPRDELLFAMLLLGSRSTDEIAAVTVKTRFGAFRPPLINLHNLVVGSSIRFGTVHQDMLKMLVFRKGGVDKISMPFLGEFFNTMDLFQASTNCTKPAFGLCRAYLDCIHSDIIPARRRYQQSTSRPPAFPTAVLEDSFQDLLWDIRYYLHMVETSYYRQTWPSDQPRIPIALYRNVIQHRILSLAPDACNPHRELCRIAVLLFSCVVVYPLQNLMPLQQYLDALTRLLRDADADDIDIGDDFELWLLFLGAMSSAENGKTLQSWYISRLEGFVPEYGKEWSKVREVLQSFLWLDVACGEGALEIWHRMTCS